MIKKLVAIMTLAIAMVAPVQAQQTGPDIYGRGELYKQNSTAYFKGERLMVPLKDTIESIGGTVQYDPATKMTSFKMYTDISEKYNIFTIKSGSKNYGLKTLEGPKSGREGELESETPYGTPGFELTIAPEIKNGSLHIAAVDIRNLLGQFEIAYCSASENDITGRAMYRVINNVPKKTDINLGRPDSLDGIINAAIAEMKKLNILDEEKMNDFVKQVGHKVKVARDPDKVNMLDTKYDGVTASINNGAVETMIYNEKSGGNIIMHIRDQR